MLFLHRHINPLRPIRFFARDMTTPSSSTPHPNQKHQEAPSKSSSQQSISQSIAYHNRTKHSLTTGYARGPGGLDWVNQPNPFLRFPSPLTPIPLIHPSPQHQNLPLHYPSLFNSFPSPPSPLNLSSLSDLLFNSLALSAWKSAGYSTWSLRVNPSSGNLHPTEAHILSPPVSDMGASSNFFVAHYAPRDHVLEPRAFVPDNGLVFSSVLPPLSVLMLALSSICWREAWKYGERALRYCNHDVGHALAAVAIAAAALGWDAKILDGLSDRDLENLIGVRKTYPPLPEELPARPVKRNVPWVEAQHPDCAVLLFPAGTEPEVDYLKMSAALEKFADLEWLGKPNSLSKDHVVWDMIYRTAETVKKLCPVPGEQFVVNPFHKAGLLSEELYKDFTVREVVRKRRSAVDMDGKYVMGRETFYQMLLHCLPSGMVGPGERQGQQCALPFRVLPWDAEVHAALFVHRVARLPRGLYFLVRNVEHFDALKRAMRSDFEWERPEGCPDGLPLYRLATGDCQRIAMQLSCHQDIASHGCFSLGMVARFEPVLCEKGAWMYPRLFWETGVLGQVLYLEAHAVGISATGIGCYFDDAVHEVLGLKDLEFQSLYHFTVGAPVIDKRIMSLPAYPGPGIDA